jgi:hypothetical protein
VWQTTYVKYSVEADTEDDAKDLISTGDDSVFVIDSEILNNEDWDIIEIVEEEEKIVDRFNLDEEQIT